MKISQNQKIRISEIVKYLADFGYSRADQIKSSGEFLVLGDQIKIFSINSQNPIGIDFFANEIETIYTFNLETNKKISRLKCAEIKENILRLSDNSIVNINEYIVHFDYGIGLFSGLVLKKINNRLLQYISLEYINNNKIFLPIGHLEKISKYIGVGRKKPRLSRIGSISWSNTKRKTYDSIIKIAKELLEVYAKREIITRNPVIVDRDWDKIVRKSFGFKETRDQEQTIEAIYNDFAKNVPMDRLVCGDVGFGKTEVAIRASVQMAANGKQVCILCPTTILAEQHYLTFQNRLAELPIKIEKISRFEISSQRKIIKQINNGKTDIIIGTHRLLSSDIKFNNLGLLIIDEEQRFGVKQKEILKKFRESIDVLSLSATPIPRTLFMALSGIRDISEINTPPTGRKDISTLCAKYDDVIISQYINREIKRGGKIYYLHNSIDTIQAVAKKIELNFPKAKVEIAHGRMDVKSLENSMKRFVAGESNVLVCTSIIANGLDIKDANTLIVEKSENFGLSELYQIRGRIGRSSNEAYALFLYSRNQLSKNAFLRLKSLGENTSLGSGFNIALSDLEIRGGGNILGREQHGNMAEIGLVLYSKMLKMAVDKIKSKNS